MNWFKRNREIIIFMIVLYFEVAILFLLLNYTHTNVHFWEIMWVIISLSLIYASYVAWFKEGGENIYRLYYRKWDEGDYIFNFEKLFSWTWKILITIATLYFLIMDFFWIKDLISG